MGARVNLSQVLHKRLLLLLLFLLPPLLLLILLHFCVSSYIRTFIPVRECTCSSVCLDARCFCVYAEPTIHSRIRLASTGFVAKAYIHGWNKRETKMALPPKNWEENREEFFTGVDRRLSEPKRSGKQGWCTRRVMSRR